MIPVRLTIQGLYSYQEKQVIDFTRLTSANLFGIFGSVGSGKSSILEAITFAIYGRTDRLNITGDDRYYNMMNLKSNELFIEFDFETGKEQTAYKAVVRGKRNGKKYDEVKALDRSAYRKDGENWVPIEPDFLAKAIGLSYDNFKRTIIIPQGQFQEFLQLGNKDRTQMMKELFNLEKYEMFYRVTSLEFKNNAQKQNIEGQLQQLEKADKAQVKEYEEQLVQLKVAIDQLNQEILDLQKTESEMDQLQQLVKKFDDNQRKYVDLKEQEKDFNLLETTIFNYEHCSTYLKGPIETLAVSTQRIAQNSLKIEQEKAVLDQSDIEIRNCETVFAELKIAYDSRDLLKQRAEELDKITRLNKLASSVATDEDRLTKGQQYLEKTIAQADKLKSEKDNLEKYIRDQKEKLPDLAMLSKVQRWHTDYNNLCIQLDTLKADLQKNEAEKNRIHSSVVLYFQKQVFHSLPKDASVADAIQFLKDHITRLKDQVSHLDHETAHCRVQAKLDEYAENLKDGEACPLCGSLQHPVVFSAASLAETILKLQKEKQLMEKLISEDNDFILHLTGLVTQSTLNRDQFQELDSKIRQMEAKLAAHKELFQWNDFRDESTVSKAFSEAENILKNLKLKENNLLSLAAQYEKEIQNKEKFQKEIEKIQTSLTVGKTEIKTLSGQIQLLRPEEYLSRHSMEIESEKNQLMQQYSNLEKQFTNLTTQFNQLRKEKDTVTGSLQAHKKELLQEQEINTELREKLAVLLEKAGYKSEEEVKKVLSAALNLDVERKKLNEYRQQMASLKSQVTELEQEIGKRSYDSDVHKKLKSELITMKESLDLKNQQYGRAKELLRKLKSDLENKAILMEQLEAVELRAENIRVMKSLFKGSGFVNFISSVYLQNLCNAANERFFQLTRQKLSLEITDDNCFQVRDFMNGGKLRSVKTLSGGQTFQAALSLALALADNIQKITDSNQNFFFLDEGFGSLDKDSLAVVFDSLKSLRKENRIVGVISHVEEMQQEIDTHLRIENSEESGSRIKASWEG